MRKIGPELPEFMNLIRQAGNLQEFTSTAEFGTSMSAHHILGLEQVPRVRLFAD